MSAQLPVQVRRDERGVCHLTLNRPDVRNAMSLAMVDALRAALAAAEGDGATRVIVLRGAGGHFSAGADLKDMADARLKVSGNPHALAEVNARFGELCAAFAASPLATVTVLEGTVMGGGFGLACVVDVALAGPTVSFRLPETSLGLPPAQIAPWLVQRLGVSQARRLAVTGARLDGAQALALGLVHEHHADDAALEAALARVCGEILHNAPGAVAATKALIERSRLLPPEVMIGEAAEAFARAAVSAEGNEGTAAFLQRRRPSWAPTA